MFYKFQVGFLLASAVFLIYGCGSIGQTASEETQSAEAGPPEETKTAVRPSWYTEQDQSDTDTLGYNGYAMAVATDSATSLQKAFDQARIRLEHVVGDSLEKLRKSLLSSKGTEADRLSDSAFIVKLRNSTSFVEERATVEQTEVKRDDKSWVAFVRVRILHDSVADRLRQSLAEYPVYLRAL